MPDSNGDDGGTRGADPSYLVLEGQLSRAPSVEVDDRGAHCVAEFQEVQRVRSLAHHLEPHPDVQLELRLGQLRIRIGRDGSAVVGGARGPQTAEDLGLLHGEAADRVPLHQPPSLEVIGEEWGRRRRRRRD